MEAGVKHSTFSHCYKISEFNILHTSKNSMQHLDDVWIGWIARIFRRFFCAFITFFHLSIWQKTSTSGFFPKKLLNPTQPGHLLITTGFSKKFYIELFMSLNDRTRLSKNDFYQSKKDHLKTTGHLSLAIREKQTLQ